MAQVAGAGLIQRLQALEAKVAALEERRFEGGDLLIHKDQFPELLDTSNCAGEHRGIVNKRVTFSQPFVRTPKVVSGVTKFAIGEGGSSPWHRLDLYISTVDEEGFTYSFTTYCDTALWYANGSWFAFLEDEPPEKPSQPD